LDTSFGSGGTAATELVGQLHGLQFRPDGTLFAAGSAPCPACSATEGRLGLAQFDSTGHSNSAFGTNGVASSEIIGGCAPALSSVTVAPDGSVFAGGTACGDSGPIIIKFTSTGQVDPTFGDNGMYQPAAAPAGSVPQAPNGLHGLTWTPAGLVYGTEAVRTSSAATPDSIFSAERVLTSGGSPYPDRTPLTTITPQVVKFGQVATVAVTGTAGATVDLYARRYPDRTFTQIRSGIVLDSAGRASIPTKPDVNLRFQVIDRALPHSPSSVGGADGLITVQKNLTLNARRISLRRYTFTGSMNPYQRGATVSLYRNGTLVRSGIPVSSSKVYSYTAMLAAGTASFQFRSAATGYNGASGSSTKSVRIF
jgi:hypothetical protein